MLIAFQRKTTPENVYIIIILETKNWNDEMPL